MTISVSFQMFIFFHSTFDVGRSMFDVHLFFHLLTSDPCPLNLEP